MHTSLRRVGFTVASIFVSIFLVFSVMVVGITAAPQRAHADVVSGIIDAVIDNLPLIIMVAVVIWAPQIAAAMGTEVSAATAATMEANGLGGLLQSSYLAGDAFVGDLVLKGYHIGASMYTMSSVTTLGIQAAGALGAVAFGTNGGDTSITPTSATCPPGATGTPPNCLTDLGVPVCPVGQSGTPPNCTTTVTDGRVCYSTPNSCGQAYQGKWSVTIYEGDDGKIEYTDTECSVANYLPPESGCPPPTELAKSCPAGFKLVQFEHPAKTCSNGIDACTTPAQAPTADRLAWNPNSVAAGNGCSLGYWSGNTGNYCWQNPINGVCPLSPGPAKGSFDYAEGRQLVGSGPMPVYGTSHESALMCYASNVPTCVPDLSVSVSCSGSPGSPFINQPVTWSSSVTGGSGSYIYEWNGTDNLWNNESSSVQKSYTTVGAKQASLSVTDTQSGKTASATCTSDAGTGVNVSACTASLTASPSIVEQGQNTSLSWSTTGGSLCVSSCSGNGFNTGGATSGIVNATTLPAPPSTTYALTCTAGAYGPPAPANTTVTVLVPTVTISVNGQTDTIRVNPETANNVVVAWSSTNSVSCTTSKNAVAWKSGLSSSGTSDSVTVQTIYKADCVNRYGIHATRSVIVNVLAKFEEF